MRGLMILALMIGGLGIGLGWSSPVLAHALKLFVTNTENGVEGRAYFAGGSAAKGIDGKMIIDGREITFTTDDDGRFSIPQTITAPAQFMVQDKSGHRAKAQLKPVTTSPAPTPQASPVQLLKQAGPQAEDNAPAPAPSLAPIENQITLMREEISALKDRLFLSDVIGGIGLIIGLFGALAFFKARKS